MNCPRCGGLMIVEHFQDFLGSYGEMWMTGRRCVNCGHLADAVTEQNREAQQATCVMRSSSGPDYHNAEVHRGAEALTRHVA